MPAQSCLLPFDGYNGLDIVPFISEHHPVTTSYFSEHSPLTMSLRDRHLHCASASSDLFSIDFQLATSIWFILKDISRTIQLAANPLLDPFGDLPGTIDPELLERIDMPFPTVLSIENYTQNLLVVMSSRAELVRLFSIAQKVRMDGAQWIQRAREKCVAAEDGLGWDWSETGTAPAYFGELPKQVHCGYIGSSTGSEDSSVSSTAVVLHPTLSNYAKDHPGFNPFTLSDNDAYIESFN